MPSLDDFDEALTGNELTWEDVVSALVLLAVGFGLSYLIGRWRKARLGRPDGQSQQLVGLLARVAQILVIAIFVGWALTRLGSDIGFLTVVVLVALLIGVLAARPVIEGMGASAALTTRPAFEVGDEVIVDETSGEVIEITNRSTVIRQPDASTVHIPNVEMLDKTVTVLTVDRDRRSSVDVTVALDADVDHVDQVISAALAKVDAISRVGSIQAQELAVGVKLSIRFWHPPTIEEGNAATDAAIRATKKVLEAEGISLAPTMEIAGPDRGAPGPAASDPSS